jgi:hypothetical protein
LMIRAILSSLVLAVRSGKRHRAGRNSLYSNKEDSFPNRLLLSGAPTAHSFV